MKKKLIDRLHERFASSSMGVTETSEDVLRWRRFIDDLPEAEDCYAQAYNRYRCRMYYFSTPKKIFINLLGFGALFVEMFYLLMPSKELKKPEKGLTVIERARDIPDFSDVLPQDIYGESDRVDVIENHNEKFGPLCKDVKPILWKCMSRHPFSFFFNYFVYIELVAHSGILLAQNPEITVVYINERNVASPILTDFYHAQGRKLYSFMHGEYPLQLTCALMRFSRYYVWDNSYVDMFSKDLRCMIDEYVVYTPKKLQKKWNLETVEPEYDITYYFSGEDEPTTRKALDALKLLSDRGMRCKVRPHPRFKLHIKSIGEQLTGSKVLLESTSDVSLRDSLASTKYVVGLQSTVLSEAVIEGRAIVLDDISNPERFELLKTQKFNLFNKPHRLFSDLVREMTADGDAASQTKCD